MKKLSKGSTIALIAPARKIKEIEIAPALEQIKKWGFNILLAPNVLGEHYQFSGTDSERLADVQWAIDHPKVDAILCARGGYGSVRLIDKIDFTEFIKNPKWFIGYSDITVFHEHINHVLGLPTLHATMPINFTDNTPEAKETLFKALTGNSYSIEIDNKQCIAQQNISAPIVGGNLSIIYSLLGSSSSIDTKDKILFVEDLDEYLYHIDRMMQNIKRNGLLSDIKALIIGGMTQMHDNATPFGMTAEQIINDICKDYDFPIIYNFPAGHINDNRALIFNQEVQLKITKEKITIHF